MVALPGPPPVRMRMGTKFCTAETPEITTTIRNCGRSSGTSTRKTRPKRPTPSTLLASRIFAGKILESAEKDQEAEIGDPREPDEEDGEEREMRIPQPVWLPESERMEHLVDQAIAVREEIRPDVDKDDRRHHDRKHQCVLDDRAQSWTHVHDDFRRRELHDARDHYAAEEQNDNVVNLGTKRQRMDVLRELGEAHVSGRIEAVPGIEPPDEALHGWVVREYADQQKTREEQHDERMAMPEDEIESPLMPLDSTARHGIRSDHANPDPTERRRRSPDRCSAGAGRNVPSACARTWHLRMLSGGYSTPAGREVLTQMSASMPIWRPPRAMYHALYATIKPQQPSSSCANFYSIVSMDAQGGGSEKGTSRATYVASNASGVLYVLSQRQSVVRYSTCSRRAGATRP